MTLSAGMSVHWADFSDVLFRFYLKKTGDEELAQDLRQEALVKMLEHFDKVNEEEKRSAWMWSIAHNLLKDHWRKSSKKDEAQQASQDDIEQYLEMAVDCLHKLIASLPDKYREALTLTDLKGMKQAEVAKHLGISVSGAKSRVQRGRSMLKEKLRDCCDFELNQHRQWKNDKWMDCG